MTEATPTPQAPAAAEPVTPATPVETPAASEAPKPGDPGYAFKSEESANAVLADLVKVREQNKTLKEQFEAQNKAMAAVFGLEEAPKADDLAETVKSLIQQELAPERLKSTRLEIAAQPGVDAEGKPLPAIPPEFHNLLTETDTEKLKAQAVTVAALIAANSAAAATPEFQPNPGQGQGGSSPAKEDDSYPSHWVPKKPATT